MEQVKSTPLGAGVSGVSAVLWFITGSQHLYGDENLLAGGRALATNCKGVK